MQANYQTLNSESMYFEMELIDLNDIFQLLIGYADKSNTRINKSHILLNSNIYGVNVNKKQYSNTFVHTLKQGDIIGCFYDASLKEIISTHNGSDLCCYQFHSTTIYSTIYSTRGTSIKYNLGSQHFLYCRVNELRLGLECNYVQETPPGYLNNFV